MSALVGTPALVRLALRRDRVRLPVWVGALVAITYLSAAAVADTYDTPVKIESYAANIGSSPASIAMAGPPIALHTIGGILVLETGLTVMIGVALMSIFTVVRHTRAEEEAGRTELLVSTVVSRHANMVAALTVAGSASVLVGAGVTMSVLAQDMRAPSAVLYGAAVAALGLVFAAVAATAAQLMTHARGSTGLSLAALGVAFLLRAIGDVRENFLSWLSPIGWSQQVRVLDGDRWWPLLLSAGLVAALLALAPALAVRRDVGSGMLPARPGPAHAAASLLTPRGLAWRQQRASVLAWTVGVFVIGLMFGSLTEQMQNMVRDNERLAEYFDAAGGNVTDSLFATALLFVGLGAGAFAVGSVLRLRHEETAGRLEPVLAASVSRTRALAGALVVTLVGAVVMVLAGGVGVALTYGLISGRTQDALQLVGLAFAQLPAVLVLAGGSVALTGWLPRATMLAWVGVAIAFVVGWLGGLLEVPEWLRWVSPYDHVPAVPLEPLTILPLAALSLVAVALLVLGAAGFRRRDIG